LCHDIYPARLITTVSLAANSLIGLLLHDGRSLFSRTAPQRQAYSMFDISNIANTVLYVITKDKKAKYDEIRHLENRHDVIFSAVGGPI